MTEALLTLPEVAALLRVSRAWVYRNAAHLGVVRLGGLRFRRDLVSAYVEARTCPVELATVSSGGRSPRSGSRSGPTPKASPTASPRAAEIAAKLRTG